MAKREDENLDTQIIAENVAFLDECFDVSFLLQNSIIAAKEFLAEESAENFSKSITTQKHSSIRKSISILESSVLTVNENTQDNNKKLMNWGLPPEIVQKYEQRGVINMFDWQVSCLMNSKVLHDCCNLVYSAPTSAGKTLVAEILTIKTVLERQKKVIIILPFVSIVREKMFYLQDILSSSGVRVEGFMGSQAPPGGLQATHVAICTIEKANSLVNRLLDEDNITELGAVIVDELHLLGDPHRGYILELLLTKIKYMSWQSGINIQIVGMSATLPNLEILSKWLDAELFITQFRPIPLEEYCLVGNQLYNPVGDLVKVIDTGFTANDNVLQVCLDTIKDGCSILIFCLTKNWCENLSQTLASTFCKLGSSNNKHGKILREQLKADTILEVLEQLKNCPVGLDQVLKNVVSFGVAYHHAGLTFDERDIIEGAFKSGAVRVLIATSTLSSGVNLPARRVIIRSPVFQKQPINILTYKQMAGRAGRMGRDDKGESIIISTETERKIAFELMKGTLDPVLSCIGQEDKFMRAVLEVIASQVACKKTELELYSQCTLLHYQQENVETDLSLLDATLKELENYELIRRQTDDTNIKYIATSLGKACLSSSMAPNDGLSLFCELQKARQCLVLETELHLLYLVTPYSVSSQWGNIDWLHLLTLWESLTKAMKRVGELVGVQESFMIRCVRGASKLNNNQNKMLIHKRFYTALALQDLVNEIPLNEVASKFQCPRGFLQSLQQASATFAGMVTAFCHQLGWKNMELLFSQFQDRLHFGIHSELLELMRLPSLNGKRARCLFDSGFESLSAIALADVNLIENALLSSIPFQSEKERDGDDSDDAKKRNKIKNIWVTGYCGLTTREAADSLIKEARQLLQREIGVNDIKWKNDLILCDGKIKTGELYKKYAGQSNDVNIRSNECNIIDINDIGNKKDIMLKEPNIVNIVSQKCIHDHVLRNTKDLNHYVDRSKDTDDIFLNKTKEEAREIDNIETHVLRQNIIEKDVIKEIKNVIQSNSNESHNVSTPVDKKSQQSTIWESLNFTENAFINTSKFKVPDQIISSVNTTKNFSLLNNNSEFIKTFISNASTKDISLFSSDDGDNSSLFEDSLPLDLIPTKILDELNMEIKDEIHNKDCEPVTSKEINNELLSEDENIKLYYDTDTDDGNKICTNSNEKINSLENNQPLRKKMKIDEKASDISHFIRPILTNIDSKSFVLNINNTQIECFHLKHDDVMNFLYCPSIINVSMYLNIETKPMDTVIGAKLLGKNPPEETSCMNNNSGIGLLYNDQYCVYLDIGSCNDRVHLAIQQLLTRCNLQIKLFSAKQISLNLKRYFNLILPKCCEDISLIEWLINSDEKEPSMNYLIKKYLEIDISKIYTQEGDKKHYFPIFDAVKASCTKAWFIWKICLQQKFTLEKQFPEIERMLEVEVQVSKILSISEYNGITVNKILISQFLVDVQKSQSNLQNLAYKICGQHFNFNSSKEVAKVLGIYNGRKVSTKKSVLNLHKTSLSSIIIYWRKLNAILTKTLYPLTSKAVIYTKDERLKPTYTMHTCSGRISMQEPNLQSVPRTFTIPISLISPENKVENECDVMEFNCRNIFKASTNSILVSADYCQLEMRILTHYCKDLKLTKIMKSDADVFTSIAASWASVPEDQVDDDLRQKVKQLCYGIIYGMGSKSLAQVLDVSDMEATVFMNTLHKTYPAIKEFTQKLIEECRKKGYIETLMKRRRYLPDINSKILAKKNLSERQAVNTTIQGSAADIAKAAMCAIEDKIDDTWKEDPPRLLLQLHDELIYEVAESKKSVFVKIMKNAMENTIQLNVPLPVKVKSGYTWGTLQSIVV